MDFEAIVKNAVVLSLFACASVMTGFYWSEVHASEISQIHGLAPNDQEFVQIQKYYEVRAPYLELLTERRRRLLQLTEKPRGEDLSHELKETARLYDERIASLFAESGLSQDQYESISRDLLTNPAKIRAFKKAGGVIHPIKSSRKESWQETPAQRLEKKGIILEPLNEEVVSRAMEHSDPSVKLDVIKVIAQSGDSRLARQLLNLLWKPDPGNDMEPGRSASMAVRLAAAAGLCEMRIYDGVPLIIKGLHQTSAANRLAAIMASKSCAQSEDIRDELVHLLQRETSGSMRLQAAMAIQKTADVSMLDALISINKKESDVMVRRVNDKTIRLLEAQQAP
jgi:hypothetical protein